MSIHSPFHYVAAGKGRRLQVLADQVHLLATGKETGGTFAISETIVTPLTGPPPHVHHREDETFYVLEGEFDFRVGDEVIHAYPGDCLYAPRDIPHSFVNTTQTPGRLLVTITPAGFEGFFEEVDRMSGEAPDMGALMALAAKYGLEFLPPA